MKQGTTVLASVAATGFVITAAEAGDWLTFIERMVASPVSPFLIGAMVVIGFIYVLNEQRKMNARCIEENDQLESVVQQIYLLLATDDRFPNFPPFEEVKAGKFSIVELHKQRTRQAA